MPESAETSRANSNSNNRSVEMESLTPESSNFIRYCTAPEALCSPESTLDSALKSSKENNGMSEEEIETIRTLAQALQAALCLNSYSSEGGTTSLWKFTPQESQQNGAPEFCDFNYSNAILSEENRTEKENEAENSPDRECFSEEEISLMRENLFKFQWNGISKECLSEALKHLFKPTAGDKPHASDPDVEAYREQYDLQATVTIASVVNYVLDDTSYKPVDYIEVQNSAFFYEQDQAISVSPNLESSQSSSDSTNHKSDAYMPCYFYTSKSDVYAQGKFRSLLHGLTNTLEQIDDLVKVMDSRPHWKRMIRNGRLPLKDTGLLFDSVSDSFPFQTRIDMNSRILRLWTETGPKLSKLAIFLRKILGSWQTPMTCPQMKTVLVNVRKTISAATTPDDIREYSDLCEKLPASFNASSDARYVFGVERRVFAILADLMNATYEIDRMDDVF